MYRDIFGICGWEKLTYAARKELIHYMSNNQVVTENIEFMEKIDNNFKTKVNSLVMFDNYHNNFVRPVSQKRNMHLWGYEQEKQIIDQAEASQIDEAWLTAAYTQILDAMDDVSHQPE